MLFMPHDMNKFIKQYEDKGVCKSYGKNVCLWLNEVHALLYETMIDVLMGLTNCSLPDFVKLFDFLLQWA